MTLVVLALICAACASPDAPGTPSSRQEPEWVALGEGHRSGERAPDIVLVVIDDFSMDLVPTMRSMRRLERVGASYPHSFVVDSLCCVSRASILTGQYPHQTGVRANNANLPNPDGPVGGWRAFETYGNGERAFAVQLQRAGYTTGFVGKYLNEYAYSPQRGLPPTPQGWDEFRALFGGAYAGWDFAAIEDVGGDRRLLRFPAPPAAASDREKDRQYAGTVTADLTRDFLAEHRRDASPYFLLVAPYAPHARIGRPTYRGDPWAPAAFRDRPSKRRPGGNCGRLPCGRLGLDDLAGWGDDRADNRPRHQDGRPVRRWLRTKSGFTRAQSISMLRQRARMAQSVDRMLTEVIDRVERQNRRGRDTVLLVTSDNGLHLGQHGFAEGKGLAYDTDVRVPLYVAGPGIAPGPRRDLTSNIDLAPTIEELAGLPPADYRAGLSLRDSLHGGSGVEPRADYVFIEHTWARTGRGDPDRPFRGTGKGQIPDYVAVRSRTGLLIRSDLNRDPDRERYVYEFYSYRRVGWERRNQFAAPRHRAEVDDLRERLERFDACQELTRGDDWTPECAAVRSR